MAFFDLITNCLFSWWWLLTLKGVLHIQDAFTWKPVLSPCHFGQTSGEGEGQEGLACCSPWGCKELDTNGRLNYKESSGADRRCCSRVGASHASLGITRLLFQACFLLHSHQQKESLHCFMSVLTLGINFCHQGQFEILSAYLSFYSSEY